MCLFVCMLLSTNLIIYTVCCCVSGVPCVCFVYVCVLRIAPDALSAKWQWMNADREKLFMLNFDLFFFFIHQFSGELREREKGKG